MLRWDEKKIKNKLEKSKKTRRQKELIDGEFSVFLLKKKTHTHTKKNLRRCPVGQILLMVKRVERESLATL